MKPADFPVEDERKTSKPMPTLLPHSAELQALLDAVRADFERDDLRLILADWLDERDDPRGEMIRLSCGWAAEEHNSPQRDRLKAQLETWKKRWVSKWLGSLTGVHLHRGQLLLCVDAGQHPIDYFLSQVGPELQGWVGGVQCWPSDDRTLAALTAWPWLPILNLQGASLLTDTGASHLAHLTGLRGLSLNNGNGLTGAALDSLLSLEQLQQLSLFGHSDGLADGLHRLEELPALESLGLTLPWPGPERFAAVGRLPRLHHLNLTGSQDLPEEAFTLLKGLAGLQELRLYACKTLTGTGLAAIAELPSLRWLDASLCWQIRNVDVTRLSRTARGLERLELEGCSRLTDRCLEHLGRLTRLKTLNVSECKQISGKGLGALAGLAQLEHLKLSGCRQLTDEALLPLQHLTALRILRLRDCPRLSADGLAALAGLTRLRWLDLRKCPQLNEADRRRLRQTWPECEITF